MMRVSPYCIYHRSAKAGAGSCDKLLDLRGLCARAIKLFARFVPQMPLTQAWILPGKFKG